MNFLPNRSITVAVVVVHSIIGIRLLISSLNNWCCFNKLPSFMWCLSGFFRSPFESPGDSVGVPINW